MLRFNQISFLSFVVLIGHCPRLNIKYPFPSCKYLGPLPLPSPIVPPGHSTSSPFPPKQGRNPPGRSREKDWVTLKNRIQTIWTQNIYQLTHTLHFPVMKNKKIFGHLFVQPNRVPVDCEIVQISRIKDCKMQQQHSSWQSRSRLVQI